MSDEQLKAFVEAIKADKALQQKLQGIADPDAIVSIAREAGFMISTDHLREPSGQVELSDEQLDAVSGGESWIDVLKTWGAALA